MSMDAPEPKYQKEVIKFLRQQNSHVTNLENSLDDTDAAFAALGHRRGGFAALQDFQSAGRVAQEVRW